MLYRYDSKASGPLIFRFLIVIFLSSLAVANSFGYDELKTQKKSALKSFLLSAVIPGAGQIYAGSKKSVVFLSAEITLLTSYIVLNNRANELKNDYISFVDENIAFEEDSPVRSTAQWTLEDYEHATQSDNWHYVYTEHNGQPIPRVGKFYWKDLPQDKIDEPGGELICNSALRKEAYKKRISSNIKFKQVKRCIGLIVANHIVSAIDARLTILSQRRSIDSKVSLNTGISANEIEFFLSLAQRF